MESSVKFPREALADALRRIADHAEHYKIDGLSVAFDGTMYRVSFYGDGELKLPGIDPDDTEPSE